MIKIMDKNNTHFNIDNFMDYVQTKTPVIDADEVFNVVGLYEEVCKTEGVDLLVALSQVLYETVNFTYRNRNKKEYYNYGGIRVNNQYVQYASAEEGILAHVQMLKGYACKDSLNTEKTTDYTRLEENGLLGTAPNVIGLAGSWIIPGFNKNKYPSLENANEAHDTYGYAILGIYDDIVNYKAEPVVSKEIVEETSVVEEVVPVVEESITSEPEKVEEVVVKKEEVVSSVVEEKPLSITDVAPKAAPTSITTATVQSPAATATTCYRVICGTFRERRRAENIKAKLLKKKFNVSIEEKNSMYCVYSGTFSTTEAATTHMRKILGAGIGCNIVTDTKF